MNDTIDLSKRRKTTDFERRVLANELWHLEQSYHMTVMKHKSFDELVEVLTRAEIGGCRGL